MTLDLDRFGNLDVYLFDQLLRGRLTAGMRVLDAGCGSGRHLTVLHHRGCDFHGLDASPQALEAAEATVREAGGDPTGRLHCAPIEALPFPDADFDFVVCCAVLHFASDDAAFSALLDELWRVLRPGGRLFVRTASTMGIESDVGARVSKPVTLPDGSDRFLVDAPFLRAQAERLGARPLDPIKSTVVDGMRSMATWVVEK
jgi:SAM-dependent methyltransferase